MGVGGLLENEELEVSRQEALLRSPLGRVALCSPSSLLAMLGRHNN
jgi:hypothetical protein